MRETTPLFALVQSMSQSERRYFSRFATLQTPSSTNRYFAFFKRLAGSESFDAVSLKKEFGEKHFEQLKQQLYRKILEALRLYYQESDIESRIGVCRSNYVLLAGRGMEMQAGREIQKGLMLAREKGLLSEAQVLFLQRTRNVRRNGSLREVRALQQQQKTFVSRQIQLLQNEWESELLFTEAEIINRQFEASRSPAELVMIDGFLKNPLLANENSGQTPRSKLLRLFSKGLVSFLRCDFESCARLMHQSVLLVKQFPALRETESELVIRSYANRTLALFQAGQNEKFRNALKAFRETAESFPRYRDYSGELIRVLELMQLNREKKYAEAVSKIRRDREFGHRDYISQQDTYYLFQAVVAYRGNGDLRKASSLLHAFISQNESGIKKDAFITARLLFVIIRYEMNDEALLQSALKSLRRFLNKENKMYAFEKRILQFAAAMQTIPSPAQRRRALQQLKEDLQALKKIPYERNAFLYFDAESWVEEFWR